MIHVAKARTLARALVAIAASAVWLACSNNPYPGADDKSKVLYTSFGEAPKTLDPAVSYNVGSHAILAGICETLCCSKRRNRGNETLSS